MAFIPNKLESAFIQRDSTNTFYEQINISGSDLIVYHSSSGELTADKIWNFAAKYNLGGGGGTSASSSWASASISASYAESSSTTPFNGNRLIKRSPYTTVNVGTSTVTDFLEQFFFPFIPATLALYSSVTYETGSAQNFAVNSIITANDEITYGTGSVRKDGSVWQTVGAIPPVSFNYTDTGITENHSYVSYAQTDNDGTPSIITSNTINATFYFPYLWGVSTIAGLSGNALYTEFARQVVGKSDKTVSMVGNTVYMYFCYPVTDGITTYGELNSILDKNLFEVKSGFEHSASVPVTSSGLTNTWMTNYHVYRTKIVSDPNGNYQFKY